jgi:hypothetical protein
VDRDRYASLTENRLTALYESITPLTSSDMLTARINTILIECSKECAPPPRKVRKAKRLKWTPELKPAIAASKRAYYEWQASDEQKDDRPTLLLTVTLAKKHLRKTQRQIAARERIKAYEEIMNAKTHDKQTFYKLIRRQRDSPHAEQMEIEFPEAIQGTTEMEKWADYFCKLATPNSSQSLMNRIRSLSAYSVC